MPEVFSIIHEYPKILSKLQGDKNLKNIGTSRFKLSWSIRTEHQTRLLFVDREASPTTEITQEVLQPTNRLQILLKKHYKVINVHKMGDTGTPSLKLDALKISIPLCIAQQTRENIHTDNEEVRRKWVPLPKPTKRNNLRQDLTIQEKSKR